MAGDYESDVVLDAKKCPCNCSADVMMGTVKSSKSLEEVYLIYTQYKYTYSSYSYYFRYSIYALRLDFRLFRAVSNLSN